MTGRTIGVWIAGYTAGCLVTACSIAAVDAVHEPAVRAAVQVVEVGDIGGGEPTAGEVTGCQTGAGGEMIYAPQLDAWRCE